MGEVRRLAVVRVCGCGRPATLVVRLTTPDGLLVGRPSAPCCVDCGWALAGRADPVVHPNGTLGYALQTI